MIRLSHSGLLLAVCFATALVSSMASATGPRVSPGAFVAVENEIFAAEQPPFISTVAQEGRLVTALVEGAQVGGKVNAIITTLPLRSMVKYHLIQEHAIAALGSRMHFTAQDMSSLIRIPVLVSKSHYVYYQPAQAKTLNWDGTLASLKGLRYGALKGEDASAYKAAGITVVFGSERSLLRKLKAGTVDFMRLTPLAEYWLLAKHFPDEAGAFVRMAKTAEDVAFYLSVNTQHKNGEAVAAHFKSTLDAMLSDGRYAAILGTHLDRTDRVDAYVTRLSQHLSKR